MLLVVAFSLHALTMISFTMVESESVFVFFRFNALLTPLCQ